MDYRLLASVIDELSHSLTGARIERVYEGTAKMLCLVLRRDRKYFYLLLSPERSMPRLHLVAKKPAATSAPGGFSLYLRSHGAGGILSRVSLLNQDRIAEIRFTRQEKEYVLLLELFGSASNIILTDASLNILAVYYPTVLSDSAKRLLLPGVRYVPPGKKPSFTEIPSAGAAAMKPDGAISANREAELLFDRLARERADEMLRAKLGSCIKKALEKTERRIEALSRDLDTAGQAEAYKKAGEVILANLKNLERGREQAELKSHDGECVLVRLDPHRSPADNADRYFKKYKKAKAGRAIIAKRIAQARDEAGRLQSYREALGQATESGMLERIHGDLVADGYLAGSLQDKNKQRRTPAIAPYRTIAYLGWEILVGKNAVGNDYLTTRIARPADLWLHAEGLPGSHVLVKNPGGGDIPPAVVSRAASLAAFYSRGRSAGKVSVTYTNAGHVKKPKGAKPGLVTLKTRKTIMAIPEEG